MKNGIKKVLAAAVASTMVLSASLTSFAAKFDDVTEENYPWAVNSIESMADRGIVNGYGDGIFGPADPVSKLDSLIMLSRILGFEDEINETLLESAELAYGDEIEEFDLPYGENEMLYLLIKGVFTLDEIEDYISDINRKDPLKRYEAATIMTKALYADKNISSELIASLEYTDVADIPSSAKKYVAYVDSENLMYGMEDGSFSPNAILTRAQAAVLFDRFSQKNEYTFKTGVVANVDQTARIISIQEPDGKIKENSLTAGVMLRFNGTLINVNDIEVGYHATVTYVGSKIYSIDFTEIAVDDFVYAAFVGTATTTAKGTTITVNVIEDGKDLDTTKKTTYRVSKDCVITYEDMTCSVSALKSGYALNLTIRDGEVVVIEAEDKSKKIKGRINEIVKDVPCKIEIEENDGTVGEYIVASDVTVTRNGLKATALDLLAGDTVSTATVTYGKITSITTSSKTTEKTGEIVEVVNSKNPRITLNVKGEEITYYLANDVKIIVNGEEATLSNLEVGADVKFKVEGDTIVSLSGIINTEVHAITGTVDDVNENIQKIKIIVNDTEKSESIYVKDASISTYSNKKTVKLSTIKAGDTIIAIGSSNSGDFEAKYVIVVD